MDEKLLRTKYEKLKRKKKKDKSLRSQVFKCLKSLLKAKGLQMETSSTEGGEVELSSTSAERKELFKISKDFWNFEVVKLQERHFDVPVPLSNEDQEDSPVEDEESTTTTTTKSKSNNNNNNFDPEAPVELSCRTCGVKFGSSNSEENVKAQHNHFKSPWHSTNVSRKSQSLPPLTQSKFDSQSSSQNSSLNNSSDSNNKTTNKSSSNPSKVILYTSNKLKISFFRCILPDLPNPLHSSQSSQLLSRISMFSSSKNTWSFFMNSGGNFAFAIFSSMGTPLIHKTIKRYTVRRKQGGSQSSHDQKGSAAKSAGASMRRYHEAKLKQEIKEILVQYKSEIESCEIIFLMAAKGSNRQVFYFEGSPFGKVKKKGGKVRSVVGVSSVGNNPGFQEIARIKWILSLVEIKKMTQSEMEQVLSKNNTEEQIEKEDEQEGNGEEGQGQGEEGNKEEEEENEEKSEIEIEKERKKEEIETAMSENNLTLLKALVSQFHEIEQKAYEENEDDENEDVTNEGIGLEDLIIKAAEQQEVNSSTEVRDYLLQEFADFINLKFENYDFQTALHVATKTNNKEFILALLKAGANPGLRSVYDKIPYHEAKDKETKNIFRKFAGENKDKWDWKSINIEPLTSSMEEERDKKRKETEQKKKAENEKKKIEQELLNRRKKKISQVLEERKKQIKKKDSMSDREKRLAAIDARANGTFNSITQCEGPGGCKAFIEYGVVPFIIEGKKMCSEKCVRTEVANTIK